MNEFREILYGNHSQSFTISEVLHHEYTGQQELLIFTNPTFGKVLALDGVVQLTELDNHIYHEMIAHVPLLAHGAAKDVLIIGGGDGGTLKEVLKHPVESVVLVELDSKVVALSRLFLPEISSGAFNDSRTSVLISDGAQHVAGLSGRYDVIIVDSTDPVGPGISLFNDKFYRNCRSALKRGGLICVQSGVPFYKKRQVCNALERFKTHFGAAEAFFAPVPTYAQGMLALTIAGSSRTFCPHLQSLRRRSAGLETRYYSPDIHQAAFVIASALTEFDRDARLAGNHYCTAPPQSESVPLIEFDQDA